MYRCMYILSDSIIYALIYMYIHCLSYNLLYCFLIHAVPYVGTVPDTLYMNHVITFFGHRFGHQSDLGESS